MGATNMHACYMLHSRPICYTHVPCMTNQSELAVCQACHFFKVGQQRAQGRTMVLCLAQQLAERLNGFADLLAPVVLENKDTLAQLSLLDTFNS